ncbi:MAG: plastocyanin/azurin family copper-binding protein [Candidatus Cohnella colombiensis]|uniref:Plastocyanin/azurin family copper-binding protein n=1 Tax=Candidatus Cohnella colombiensis TaxID=3121368 RepID=A0AA95EVX6_9BACL|nr:MAG: plastocyanin/azurin family copper-binding protein [Cohnella sp.]
MKKTALVLILTFATALILISSVYAADSSPETWQVSVGKETAATSLDSMFPKVIFVHEGDKVTFTNGASATPHTVTFLAGQSPLTPQDPAHAIPSAKSGGSWDGKSLLNSGILFPKQSYEVTFTASGAYPYYCVLHPMMTGTVVVLPKGQSIPSKVEQAAAAKTQENDLLFQESLLQGPQEAQYTANKDGSLTYKVDLGSQNTAFSHNRMNPEQVIVSEGDSISWTNLSPYEPHWVTFNKPADLNFFTDKGEFNAQFMPPAGGKEFNGTGFTNSGILLSAQSYDLKFTKPGTYTYECYLHSGSMMKGTVIVVPKGAVKLVVNGKAVTNSASAQWKDGNLNVGIVSFTKAMGGKFSFDKNSKLYTITVDGKSVKTAGYILKGTTYASAENIVRGLGGTYTWNEATQSFTVTVGAPAPAASMDHMH